MSEQQQPYETAIKKLLDYPTYSWMIGIDGIEKMKVELQYLIRLANAIKKFERKHHNKIQESRSGTAYDCPELKRLWEHEADIARRAAERLRKKFNNIANEILL